MAKQSLAAERVDALKEGWIRFSIDGKSWDLNLANIPLAESGIFLREFEHGPMWMLQNGEEYGMAAVWFLARRCNGEMYLTWPKAQKQWPGGDGVEVEMGGVGSLTGEDEDDEVKAEAEATPED